MPLSRQDALRLLQFCLGPDDSCTVEIGDDGAALVSVALADSSVSVRTFEAATFDSALRQAADAGLLKAACVEKQIAFLANDPARPGAGGSSAAASPVRRLPRDLFPRLVGATAALMHETQVERGMSAIFTASSARHFRRELGRQRERTDARRARLAALRQELAAPIALPLGRRFDRVDARLRELLTVRAAIDAGEIAAQDVVTAYSDTNADLLAVGDGALVAFAGGAQHGTALAYLVLLYAKEKIGIERARFGAAFAARTFSDADRQALSGLLAARRSYLHIFSATAPAPAEQLLERALGSSTNAELARAEALILAGRESEIDLDARAWFQLASRKINLLGEIGAATLELCAERSAS